MTNEEAKAVITGHLNHWNRLLKEQICDPTEGVDTTEAFKVAIQALEAHEVVSKTAVIECIRSYIHEIITESGTDKNYHTNQTLRAIIDEIEGGAHGVD